MVVAHNNTLVSLLQSVSSVGHGRLATARKGRDGSQLRRLGQRQPWWQQHPPRPLSPLQDRT